MVKNRVNKKRNGKTRKRNDNTRKRNGKTRKRNSKTRKRNGNTIKRNRNKLQNGGSWGQSFRDWIRWAGGWQQEQQQEQQQVQQQGHQPGQQQEQQQGHQPRQQQEEIDQKKGREICDVYNTMMSGSDCVRHEQLWTLDCDDTRITGLMGRIYRNRNNDPMPWNDRRVIESDAQDWVDLDLDAYSSELLPVPETALMGTPPRNFSLNLKNRAWGMNPTAIRADQHFINKVYEKRREKEHEPASSDEEEFSPRTERDFQSARVKSRLLRQSVGDEPL